VLYQPQHVLFASCTEARLLRCAGQFVKCAFFSRFVFILQATVTATYDKRKFVYWKDLIGNLMLRKALQFDQWILMKGVLGLNGVDEIVEQSFLDILFCIAMTFFKQSCYRVVFNRKFCIKFSPLKGTIIAMIGAEVDTILFFL